MICRMRPRIFALLICALLAACATEDIAETGIPKARAVAIATNACKEYPSRFPVIDRAQWIREGRYWVVDLTDSYRERGKFFMINRSGKIIGTGRIPQDSTLPEGRYRDRRDDYDSGSYYNDRRSYDDGPVYRGRVWY